MPAHVETRGSGRRLQFIAATLGSGHDMLELPAEILRISVGTIMGRVSVELAERFVAMGGPRRRRQAAC